MLYHLVLYLQICQVPSEADGCVSGEVVYDLQQSTVNIFTMAYTESSLSRLNKDGLIRIALEMQNSKLGTNSVLTDIKNELSKLRKSYNKLEADLAVSKSVTEIMRKQIVMLERKSWSNEQYSSRECLEISGSPSSTEDSQLEVILLQIFEKMDVKVQKQYRIHLMI